ncbi:adenylate/guanylate cyclase domain-containing protein [Limibacillus halophilus]|uniref:Adenylate cyclase n=1 Tax=Limibacillus halophilus TaxID=1579333 RepID=A0A839SUZ4_9PROT|nr:adenylate/guanylate cyclase domain-containing protein [Limibacillus halophilus]MBB3066292.1 adenylate cyclase [Limibacillus halophilus]
MKIPSLRRLRLVTGLILFTYISGHLINHAMGLAGLFAMENLRELLQGLWRSLPGTILLYGSLVIHLLLAFWAIYKRRRLRMPVSEWAQLLLGLTIPPLLAAHLFGTRLAVELYDLETSYGTLLLLFWGGDSMLALKQSLLLLVAWTHGCFGIYFWLRLKRFFPQVRALLLASAVGIPLLALSGFTAAGREALLRARANPDWAEPYRAALQVLGEPEVATLGLAETLLLSLQVALLALALSSRLVRYGLQHRAGRVVVQYSNGSRVTVAKGTSVLEASQFAGIPHASVCGGRGRCSTCRIGVRRGLESLPKSSDEEQRVLDRIHAPANVRLACQLRLASDLEVHPLLPPESAPRHVHSLVGRRHGEERLTTVLFADLRGFTTLAEGRLPYDVIFLLNRFAREMGEAITEAGGKIDKFMGDGVMALFGLESSGEIGAQQALRAAALMAERLDQLNESLAHDLPERLRMGIGIHAGSVIIGEIGFGDARSLTAVGDVVNAASRMEALTKEYGNDLVVSVSTLELSGIDLPAQEQHEITLRGRRETLAIVAINPRTIHRNNTM